MAKDKYGKIKLKNQVCFPIYLCSKEIIKKYNPVLSEFDLTYTQYVVMMFFWERGSSNLKELAQTLMIDPSTLTPLLKKIERKGYIKRERAKDDERNLVITLTKEGEALKDKALSIPDKMRKCVDMSDDEIHQLLALTKKLLFILADEE